MTTIECSHCGSLEFTVAKERFSLTLEDGVLTPWETKGPPAQAGRYGCLRCGAGVYVNGDGSLSFAIR